LKVTFVDSSVLITAARGDSRNSLDALAILDDPDRTFASSAFVRLEVLPKPFFFRRTDESLFYQRFFQSVTRWAPFGEPLLDEALDIAAQAGLSALDAFHIAAAVAVGADELITAEKPSKPIHRVTGISVRSIYS
jgi:predicted nucleic acid-binding protein